MRRTVKSLLMLSGLVIASCHIPQAAQAVEPFNLTSPAFTDNAPLASHFVTSPPSSGAMRTRIASD
jgi:hypothetical protein